MTHKVAQCHLVHTRMRHFLGERVSPAQVRLAGIVARLVLRLVGCRDPNNEEEVSSAAVRAQL